jgi:cob(I)alamin adenosyltransferase
MANRLTKIYTRTGDQGTTGLADGSRIEKHSARIQAIGDCDELNASLGVLATQLTTNDSMLDLIRTVQNDLFDLGAELAMPEYRAMKDELVTELENALDSFNGFYFTRWFRSSCILPSVSNHLPTSRAFISGVVKRRRDPSGSNAIFKSVVGFTVCAGQSIG